MALKTENSRKLAPRMALKTEIPTKNEVFCARQDVVRISWTATRCRARFFLTVNHKNSNSELFLRKTVCFLTAVKGYYVAVKTLV